MKSVFLKQPVIFRTREEDPNGIPPVDALGQPAKNRDGSPAKPFKIVEHHYKKGLNQMPNDHADHPYIKAHAASAAEGAPEFTVAQLRQMLKEAEARDAAKSGKPLTPPSNGDDDTGKALWPTDDQIAGLSYDQLGDLMKTRDMAIPQKKDDRIAAIKAARDADKASA